MSGETGGWMWVLIDVGAVVLLGLALFYGLSVWRKRRSPAEDRLRDRKTEELSRQPDPEENAPIIGR